MKTTYRWLIIVSLLLTLTVIVLGAYTRLSDAGLGCPDWPGCYGHLILPEESQVNTAGFERPLETEKAWIEMIHRYAAGTLGLLILTIFIMTWRYRVVLQQPVWLAALLLLTVTFQALLGMWTVTKLLAPVIVTAHLVGGMTTLALLWLLFLQQNPSRNPGHIVGRVLSLKIWASVALCAVIVQIILGGWTSTNYAAVACGTAFPQCHGEWWPPADFAEGFSLQMKDGVDYEYGILGNHARTAIHMAHRAGALIVTFIVGGLGIWLLTAWRGLLGHWPSTMLLLLAVQITLGILNVVLALPLGVATAHTLGAALLLLAVLSINQRLWRLAQKATD